VISPVKTICTLAGHELADSVRSRRVIVMMLLYLIGAMAGTALFISALQKIEGQLVQSLGLAAPNNTGSVTATLWKSDSFREILVHLVGDRALANHLLAVPPLALFYGWLSFAFCPVLVMLTSSTRVAEEIAGQAVQIFGALLLSALGAWLVGFFRMHSFEPLATAGYMLLFALKAWIYALPFLGLALGISQLCRAPNLALVFGFMALVGVAALNRISEWQAGDGWRRIWDLVNDLTPGGHKLNLWWGDAAHLVPAVVFLLVLAAVYLLASYARFARRDL